MSASANGAGGAARIRELGVNEARERIAALSATLIDCVEGGAGVSFMAPLTRERADAFWGEVAVGVAAGERRLLVAEDPAGDIVGTVQLVFAWPENAPHRAELVKMLVRRSARRQGIARRLLIAAEEVARNAGRSLLVLDTVTGSDAERLYASLGWTRLGAIPDYALMPDGRLSDTTVFYKRLTAARG